ncbi:MAG: GumC family protein [Pseudomonadota bacterium]
MNEEFSLEDALIVLRRRLVYFLAPILVIVPIGLAVIMTLPPLYAAQGKILVESQQIPEELIKSTATAYAEERIQTISQRVLTRNRLLEVADKFNLFPSDQGVSESKRVDRMRQAFDIDIIQSNSNSRRRNRDDNTIAFTVGFSDRSPDKAFQIANEFMTLFLSEDVRARTEGASTATEFFTQESRRLAEAIDQIEDRIADYKAKNADALPENLDIHRETLIRSEEDLTRVQASITLAEEEISSLQTQIATYLAGAGGAEGPAQELLRLRTQLAALRADKTDSHPDVKAMRDQIAALERQLAPSGAVQRLRSDLAAADQKLRQARAATPVDEALVEQRRTEAAEARERLSAQIAREAASGSADLMMTQLQGRMDMAGSRLVSLEDQADALKKTIADMQDRIARTPVVERGLATLTRDYQNLTNEYQALRDKQASAQLSENLEDNQKAEKFSILESAQRPDAPSSPKRGQLALLLIAGATAAGLLFAFGAEMLFATLRGRRHLTSLMHEAPIAVIPYIRAENEPRFSLPSFNREKFTLAQKSA